VKKDSVEWKNRRKWKRSVRHREKRIKKHNIILILKEVIGSTERQHQRRQEKYCRWGKSKREWLGRRICRLKYPIPL
jgi:hypothetical protein